jgi:hypothetical protein
MLLIYLESWTLEESVTDPKDLKDIKNQPNQEEIDNTVF